MTPPESGEGRAIPLRVSILSRLVPAFSYAIPAASAGVSAILLMGVMRAMRFAESSGVAAVAGGMTEANLPVLIGLYLAAFVGVIGIVVGVIRLLVPTTTASAPAWFFPSAGLVGLVPVAMVWRVESLLIQVISAARGSFGLEALAPRIDLSLTIAMVGAVACVLLLLAASLLPLPFSPRSRPRYASLVLLVIVELVLIAAAVAFQVRTSWLHQVRLDERF